MSLSLEQWHQRFTQQAGWTRPLREYCFNLPGVKAATSILEVGCGTGAITADLHRLSQASITGIDIQQDRLAFASHLDPLTHYVAADANRLPFDHHHFSAVVCHYFLLWCPDPVNTLTEMHRVVIPGGHLLVLAEPDYTHRIDEPDTLVPLGKAQTHALCSQGAHPGLGLQLPDLIRRSGWNLVESGILDPPASPHARQMPDNWDLEWQVLEDDLAYRFPKNLVASWKELDRLAWLSGTRKMVVPTHFAIAQSTIS